MINETTITRLDLIIERMSAAQKKQAVAKAGAATQAIAIKVRMASTLRTLKQIQARQAARK